MSRTTIFLQLVTFSAFIVTLYAVSEQQHVLDMVNQYRNQNGLPSVPTSYWLTATAMMHTIDRRDNGVPQDFGCQSGHSWSGKSNQFSGPCCYSGANWECMCMKPGEISKGRFPFIAYENWVRAPTAESAVNAWKGSPSHNELMLNLNGWAGVTWKSMGAFTCDYYYGLWFSEYEDPDAGASIESLTCNFDTNTPVPAPGVARPSSNPSASPAPSKVPDAVIVPSTKPTPPVGEAKLWVGGTTVTDSSWRTMTFNQDFTDPVVVCNLFNTKNHSTLITRVRNVNKRNFEFQVVPVGRHMNSAVDVDCMAVESGVYSAEVNGVKFEAHVIDGPVTNSKFGWDAATKVTYKNTYSNPFVLGQVMTANDHKWSAFYARGSSPNQHVSSHACFVGKHVGSDPSPRRVSEKIGYIVMETASGSWSGRSFEAKMVGHIAGVDDSAPFIVRTSVKPTIAFSSMNSVVDHEGGFSIFYGTRRTALTDSSVALAIDEDQTSDLERNHGSEHVGLLVFGHY